MKTFIATLSTLCILGILFYWLSAISKQNEFTSVRHYLLKTKNTESSSWNIQTSHSWSEAMDTKSWATVIDTIPPIIEISNYKNGDVVTDSEINIILQYSDNVTATENIQTTGWWMHTLETGFNPIVVSARDEGWNIGTTYIILEKK